MFQVNMEGLEAQTDGRPRDFKERTDDRATSKRGRTTLLLKKEADCKLKKMASSGEMKSECIQIYTVRKVLIMASTPSELPFF